MGFEQLKLLVIYRCYLSQLEAADQEWSLKEIQLFFTCEGGLWHERISEALSERLWRRQLPYFSALLEAGTLDSLWQIDRKWALSLCTGAEGDEYNYRLRCSYFNISGMLGLGKTTQTKGLLSSEDITCHLQTFHCTFRPVLESQTALKMKYQVYLKGFRFICS